MPLRAGERIGVYEVVAAIGAGGMGEVYRARDTKLQRDVAIKVLPDLFARDPERLARFEREARTLAALNHPHIAQVYGVEGPALVMEFVDGDDLSQQLARSGAIPLEEALPIALQVAEALGAAHEQGIIHRDLKPANIKVRTDGTAKVLDFGLAKALDASATSSQDLDNSPTITSPVHLSRAGVILGTAAYMSPEQARGRAVNKRADIWAFGCVLFEMLSGRRPFEGEDVTDTLAAIVRSDPDWTLLPSDTPPWLRTLLRRCLEKDPRERLPDIAAARLELKEARSGFGRAAAPAAAAPRTVQPRRTMLPWMVAGVAAAVAIAAVVVALRPRDEPDREILKVAILPPAALTGAPALRLAISPDGRKLAFVAPDASGTSKLWLRPLDSDLAYPLQGTDRASSPFWSPDSRSIAFISDGKLRRIEAAGGSVVTLSNASNAPPGAWGRDGTILLTMQGGVGRVSAQGPSTAELVTKLTEDGKERVHILPSFLPDGRRFLYTAGPTAARVSQVYAGSLDSPERTLILSDGNSAVYANGHLVFLRDRTLLAQPFDPETLTLSGVARPIAAEVQSNVATGTGAFSVSRSGVLVYQSGPSSGTKLAWRDRDGKFLSSVGTQTGYRDVALSPDEKTVSVTLPGERSDRLDVWLFELARPTQPRRLTFDGDGNTSAVWSPDGEYLVYASMRKNGRQLYRRKASGIGGEEPVLEDAADKYPLGFTPDGELLLYDIPTRAATGHVWLLPMRGDRRPRPFNHTRDSEVPAQVSPNGRWAAYVRDAGGKRDIYVTSFPGATGTWQISRDGGENPRWRADGKELFFTGADSFYAVSVDTTGSQFQWGEVKTLFELRVPAPVLGTRSTYAATRDGKKFLFNMWDPSQALAPLTVIVNWPATLK